MPKNQKLRLVFSGGGSGGHILPSIAICRHIEQLYSIESVFIVSDSDADSHIVHSYGYTAYRLSTGKLRRYLSFENVKDIFKTFFAIFRSFFFLLQYRPNVVFSKGGFVSVPVALAAFVLRIPIVAHESDIVMGLANRIIAPLATMICTTFPSTSSKEIQTGIPLRSEIYTASKEIGREFLHIESKKQIVVFYGASQGSKQIMDMAYDLRSVFPETVEFVVLAGSMANARKPQKGIRVLGFLQKEILDIFAAADLVITRASATSLYEIGVLKTPIIAIPHPATGGDHQRKNARYFEEKGALVYIDPDDANIVNNVERSMRKILEDSSFSQSLVSAMQSEIIEHAEEKITAVLIN